jgi:hypothetical protein
MDALNESLRACQTNPSESNLPKFEEFVSVCAWCGKWRSGDNWFGAPIPKGKRSHGICPECYKKFNAGVPYDEVTKTWLE